jgi:hypothetical protein
MEPAGRLWSSPARRWHLKVQAGCGDEQEVVYRQAIQRKDVGGKGSNGQSSFLK